MAFGRLKQSVYTRTMDCVEQRNGGWYVAGSRVSLDSVVYAYLRGQSRLGIVESFTSLSLDQVDATIEYYLANRAAVDEYLEQEKIEFARLRKEARERDPAFYAKLDAAKLDQQSRTR